MRTELAQVLGTSVYAFMCHHSLPGLVTPVRDPAGIPGILAVDYTMIAAFYLVLANTGNTTTLATTHSTVRFPAGIFAFPKVPDLYTLAFAPPAGTNPGNLFYKGLCFDIKSITCETYQASPHC